MNRKHGWLIALAILTLLVSACGPQMATPTTKPATGSPPTAAVSSPAATVPQPTAAQPTVEPVDLSKLPVDPNDWHVLGQADAPVTIVEYSDFQWPFCARYVRETFPQIAKTYIETGKIRYEFKNFPLSSIHPQAQKAAEAAECAGELGSYWQMHELLFGRQDQWSGKQDAVDTFKKFAGELKLDQAKFDACLDGGKYAAEVQSDVQEGSQQGLSGTPAFFVQGALLSGAQPFSAFQQQIDYYLAGGQPPTLDVAADAFNSIGKADAPVVVTEFSDFQWPACASIAREVIPELIKQYVDTGKARFVSREYPLTSIHSAAQKAAEAAVCAGKQDKYWEMRDKLFAASEEWQAEGADPAALFKKYAQDLGADADVFNQCLDNGEAALDVQGDLMAGQALGVSATPTLFVNDLPIQGGLPIDALGRIIDYVATGAPTPQIVPAAGDYHLLGNTAAPAITVAFVDYASPDSAQHATEVLPQLKSTYVDPGQMLYVLHPWSAQVGDLSHQGALAAECAGEQGKYWEMHDQLFKDQKAWTSAADARQVLEGYAGSLGLDKAKFAACLDSDAAKQKVNAGSVVAALYGIPGAPVFLWNNGQGTQGSPTFDEFKAQIDPILNQ